MWQSIFGEVIRWFRVGSSRPTPEAVGDIGFLQVRKKGLKDRGCHVELLKQHGETNAGTVPLAVAFGWIVAICMFQRRQLSGEVSTHQRHEKQEKGTIKMNAYKILYLFTYVR